MYSLLQVTTNIISHVWRPSPIFHVALCHHPPTNWPIGQVVRPPQSTTMNTMRRIMNRSMRSPPSTQDNSLGLMHLRKLYVELCCTLQPLTQKEQEDKLYMMLPLFCKVRCPPKRYLAENLGEVKQKNKPLCSSLLCKVLCNSALSIFVDICALYTTSLL